MVSKCRYILKPRTLIITYCFITKASVAIQKETNQSPVKEQDKIVPDGNRVDEIAPKGKDAVIKKVTKGNILGSVVNVAMRKEMIAAKAFEPTEFAFERP